MSNKPIILTDVDGVLIKWQSGLPFFAQKYGIVSEGIQKLQFSEEFLPFDVIFGDKFSKQESEQLFKIYNSSEYIRYLSGYADALEVVNRLKEYYDFVSVSALSADMDVILNRRFNLNAQFPNAFIDFFQCDASTPKTKVFQDIYHKYKERDIVAFVDDLPHNIEDFEKVFDSPDIEKFFMVRGKRGSCEANCSTASSWEYIETRLKEKQ